MFDIYNWCMSHPVLSTSIGIFTGILLGLINLDKVKMAGFVFSQFLKKTLGEKVEKKTEELIHSFDEGMESDSPKDKNKQSEKAGK